jgi:hypothetical protein
MIVNAKPLNKPVFNPYTITITVETQQEHNDMFNMFSYYGTLPNEVTTHPEVHQRLEVIARSIYDIVDMQEQY